MFHKPRFNSCVQEEPIHSGIYEDSVLVTTMEHCLMARSTPPTEALTGTPLSHLAAARCSGRVRWALAAQLACAATQSSLIQSPSEPVAPTRLTSPLLTFQGMRGSVRRATDGHLIHSNVDTDVIVSEEPPLGSTAKPDELYNLIEHFAQARTPNGPCRSLRGLCFTVRNVLARTLLRFARSEEARSHLACVTATGRRGNES